MPTFHAQCHCGNLHAAFESARAASELPVRACQCSFCRRHGALASTDPQGRVELTAADPSAVLRYVFGLRTSEFLVCARCGVYVAAVFTDGDRAYATVNVTALDERDAFTRPAEPVEYGAEDPASRRERRRRAWTPAVVRL